MLTMLNSCAGGVTVVNIDNGFGAGYAAAVICHKIHAGAGEHGRGGKGKASRVEMRNRLSRVAVKRKNVSRSKAPKGSTPRKAGRSGKGKTK